MTTVSRTTVLMLLAMGFVALRLRGAAIVRYWPALLILPIAIHFVAPGALGGLYKSFFPEEGLIGDVSGPRGRARLGPVRRHRAGAPQVDRGAGRRPRARQRDHVPARGDAPRAGPDLRR